MHHHRSCPKCQATNPVDTCTCGRCGAALYVQTIVISQDAGAPYEVEVDHRDAAPDLNRVSRAVVMTAATLTAEVALGYLERHFLGGRPVGSAHARRLRNGALSTLTGAAVLLAEQTFVARDAAGRPR